MAHALALAIIQAPATRKSGPRSVRRRAAGQSAQRQRQRLPGVDGSRESSSAAARARTLDESTVALEHPAPGPVSGVGFVDTMGLRTSAQQSPTAPTRRANTVILLKRYKTTLDKFACYMWESIHNGTQDQS